MSRALGTRKRTALDRYKAWLIVVMGACSEGKWMVWLCELEGLCVVGVLFGEQEQINVLLPVALVY